MGAGLAVVCAVLGHPLIVAMSSGNSPARATMLRGLGAEVVLVPQVDGEPLHVTGADIAAAEVVARDVATARGGFYVDQFHAREGRLTHERTTGPELWKQAGERLDGWVACVGSGASFVGVASFLRSVQPGIVCAPVEPAGAAVLAGEAVRKPRHLLQGTGYGSVPPLWDTGLMDAALTVTDDEASEWRERLAHREGLYVGFSAAANVCAAAK
jgi:cysteine synthase A